ncbi:MAG: MoaD/ThiS family protein [Desulfamplus sp.]|nr:MoaD/ThiS family protein [Desulfamplus sp.]MBF0412516.1 MoaD/ThiS family protein [Desulfamplus sp.]
MITVGDKEIEWHEGMTIRDMLNMLEHTQFCAAVRLNGKLVSSPFFETKEIPDKSVIYLLPLIAGG